MVSLITGGAGFIGSHLAEALLREGEHVIILDDLSTGPLITSGTCAATDPCNVSLKAL